MSYFLVLTFFAAWGQGAGLGASTIPAPYSTYEACETAGEQAKANYNGGASVEWTCVAGAAPTQEQP